MQPSLRTSLFALALLTLCTAQKCDRSTAEMQTQQAVLNEGTWMLATLDGKAIQLPEGTRTPELTIGKDNAVSGFGGCNRFSGQARVEGTSIALPGLMRTKMYCEAVQPTEDAFMKALGATNAYRIAGNTLILLDKEKELASLVRR